MTRKGEIKKINCMEKVKGGKRMRGRGIDESWKEGGEVRRDFLSLSSQTYLAYSVKLIGPVAMVM